MKKYSLILLIAVMLISACSVDISSKDIPDLEGTAWTMTKVNGLDANSAANVWITFEGEDVGGSGGCNQYGGGVTKDLEGNMEFGMLFSTMMYCEQDGISDQEQEYMQALDQVVSYYISGGNLFMESADGVVLEFAPQS